VVAPRRARNDRELDPLIDGTDLSAAEVRAHLVFGAVLHIDDLLLRRVRIGVWQPALARVIAPRLQPLFQQELGWDHQRWDKEAAAFEQALEGWTPEAVR
jgi:glycerol-3-phosphate dehydrogenase